MQLMTDNGAVQLNCAASVAAEFYFRSHLGCLLDSEPAGDAVTSQVSTAPAVGGRVEQESVGGELQQAVSVNLTLIVLWKVKCCSSFIIVSPLNVVSCWRRRADAGCSIPSS